MINDFRELSNCEIQLSQVTKETNKNTLNTEIQIVEATIGNTLSQQEILPSNNKKRSAEELFGDISDIDNDIFLDMNIPTTKKSKTDDIEEKLAVIDHIVEMRRLAREKCNIISIKNKNNVTHIIERDKRNISYRVPKYPFIGLTRFDNERVYVRFHSEEYEKEEIQRIVKETAFSGVMGETFKEVWKDAKNLVKFFNSTYLNIIIIRKMFSRLILPLGQKMFQNTMVSLKLKKMKLQNYGLICTNQGDIWNFLVMKVPTE